MLCVLAVVARRGQQWQQLSDVLTTRVYLRQLRQQMYTPKLHQYVE